MVSRKNHIPDVPVLGDPEDMYREPCTPEVEVTQIEWRYL
jgi:hypothetical protein